MRRYLYLSFVCLYLLSIELYAQSTFALSTTQTPISCFGFNDASITVVPVNGTGHYSYNWSPNVSSTATASSLAPGVYTIVVTDTISTGAAGSVIYSENFDGTHNWTLNVNSGTNDAQANFWEVSDLEGGMPVGQCGAASNNDKTLHIRAQLQFATGASYNAGGLCSFGMCVATSKRSESPAFSTIGKTNLKVEFDYIANGDALNDNASVWYNIGAGWVLLTQSVKSTICSGGQGLWSKYSTALPAACYNQANLKIGIQWVNNDDGIGTDPSVAINNFQVLGDGNGTPVTQTATTTITITQPNAIQTTLNETVCEQFNLGANSYNQSGQYSEIFPAVNGCDSTVILNLTVLGLPTPTISELTPGILAASGASSYQWINCENNQAIPGAQSAAFTPNVSGNYAVVGSNGSCSDTSACYAFNKLSIESTSYPNTYQVFPNPFKDIVSLIFNDYGVYQLTCIDMSGKLITKQQIEGNTFVFDFANLKNGLYLLEIGFANGDIHRIKLVKD